MERQAEARSQKALAAILKTMDFIPIAARSQQGFELNFGNNPLAIVGEKNHLDGTRLETDGTVRRWWQTVIIG